MALELFKPFVISWLIRGEHAHNIRSATRLIEATVRSGCLGLLNNGTAKDTGLSGAVGSKDLIYGSNTDTQASMWPAWPMR